MRCSQRTAASAGPGARSWPCGCCSGWRRRPCKVNRWSRARARLPPAPQSNLRKQFYGDLVDLRGALLNTMSVAPHRAPSLHIKMHLIDSALHMLEVGAAPPL